MGYNTEVFLLFKHFLPQTLHYPGQLPTKNTCPSVSPMTDPRWHREVKYFLEGGLAPAGFGPEPP